MLYVDFLKDIKACPFCEPIANHIIKKVGNAFLTYSLAPYHKHHLLVVPTRHIVGFHELDSTEINSINELLSEAVRLLMLLGYKDYTILTRSGERIGKSVEHLHYHIIHVAIIGDLDHNGKDRRIMTAEEVTGLLAELQPHVK